MTDSKERPAREPKSWHAIILSAAFCIFLAVPCLGTLFGWDFHPPRNENRNLAELPHPKDTAVGDLPNAFEAYFKDHFGFRNTFIRRYRKIHFDLTGNRPEHVLTGQKGWLYFTRRGIMEDFRGQLLLDEKALEQWKRVFESKVGWLKARGIDYLFVIAPNKVQIYPEHLPADIQNMAGQSRADQVTQYLIQHSKVDILNLKQSLLDAKDEHVLYLSNDTHWNDYGSLIAQQQIVKALKKRYPSLKAVTLGDCETTEEPHVGDLAEMIGLDKKFPSMRPHLKPRTPQARPAPLHVPSDPNTKLVNEAMETPGKPGRILFYHDSFGKYGIKNTLPEVVGHITFVHDYPNTEAFKRHVEKVKPDIVVEMYVERQLGFRAVREKMEAWFKPLED